MAPDFPVTRSLVALAVLAAVWALALLLVPESWLSSDANGSSLARLDVAAGVLGIVGGTASILRWRLDGLARAWWVGLGLIALGIPGLMSGTVGPAYPATVAAGTLVGLALLTVAFRSPQVNAGIRPLRDAAVWMLVLVLAFAVTIPLAVEGLDEVAMPLTLAILCAITFVVGMRARRGHPDANGAWLLPLVFGIGIAQLVVALLPGPVALEAGGAALMRLAALSLAAVGAVTELHVAAAGHRARAFLAQAQADEAEQRRKQVEARVSERMHEVRSTVAALEGGVRTLDPGTVPADTQAALAKAIAAEVERLRDLVAHDAVPAEARPFPVREALEPMLTVSAAGGWPVSFELPDDLTAIGRPAELAQVVHGLLANARRYAPGSPIEVRAESVGDHVVLRVEDRGPGVPRSHRELIFERGARGKGASDPEGRGLGLYIARRIMRDMEGDLWVEPRTGGGASFALFVPQWSGLTAVPDTQPALRRSGDLDAVRPAADGTQPTRRSRRSAR